MCVYVYIYIYIKKMKTLIWSVNKILQIVRDEQTKAAQFGLWIVENTCLLSEHMKHVSNQINKLNIWNIVTTHYTWDTIRCKFVLLINCNARHNIRPNTCYCVLIEFKCLFVNKLYLVNYKIITANVFISVWFLQIQFHISFIMSQLICVT